MIGPGEVENRAVQSLTPRQAEAVQLVERYREVVGEPPPAAWIGRRLGISREAARDLMARVRDRDMLTSLAFRTRA